MQSAGEERLARNTVIVVSITLALTALAAVAWVSASAILLIFGGLLIAAIFSALAAPLKKLGLSHRVGHLVVYFLLFALLAGGLAWGGVALVDQLQGLTKLVDTQIGRLPGMLQQMGIQGSEGFDPEELRRFLPNPSGLFSSASQTAVSILGGLGNAFILLFLGIFVSWQPGLYRRGIVSLFPKSRRPRMEEVLRLSAHELVLWLAGQAISMATIFAVTLVGLWLIGMPSTFLLALQAGLLAFVPTLGPFVAGVVIVLAGFADSPQMALYGLIVYLVIQAIESNVAQPVAQRFTSSLAPALTLGAQLVFGLLFGVVGLALAVPLVAVIQRLVIELYVKDALGGELDKADERRMLARMAADESGKSRFSRR